MKSVAKYWLIHLVGGLFTLGDVRAQRALNSSASAPYQYPRSEISSALKSRLGVNPHIYRVRRSNSGKELICVGTMMGVHKTIFILSDSTNRSFASPGSIAYLNDQLKVVAWTDDLKQGVQFIGGEIVKLPPHALFDVDASGQYFIIGEKPSSIWLGSVQSPEQRSRISTNVLGDQVFVRNKQILVTGWKFQTDRSRVRQIAMCLEVERKEQDYSVAKIHEFPWASGVLDVDPHSKRLLLSDKSDMFSTVFLFDEESERKSRIGRRKDFVFFLKADLLKH